MNRLELQARRKPDHPAMIFSGQRWTYRELHDESLRMANALNARHNISAGHRVAVIMENTADHVILIHALMHLRAVYVPLNTRLTSIEVDERLNIIRPDLLAAEENLQSEFSERSEKAIPLTTIESLKQNADSPVGKVPFQPSEFSGDDLLSIIFTSGTTGVPKPVPLTYANHEASAVGSAANIGVHADDNWLCVLPLYHVGGLAIVIRCVLYGTTLTIMNGFDAEKTLHTIQSEKVTLLSLVPTMLKRLLDIAEGDPDAFKSLRAILLGGAQADPVLLAEAERWRLPVFSTYGLTEASSQIATMPPGDANRKIGSAGKPIPGACVSIRNQAGEDLPPNHIGEIWIAGPMVTSGYSGEEVLSAKSFAGNWFRTGDVGRIDDEGFLWIEGRRDDVIITGGENVYPQEIEAIIKIHPSVSDALVVGVPDDEWGQLVCAAIIPAMPCTQSELEIYCRQFLAGYKIPRSWKFVDAFPETASGKTQRSELRNLFLRAE